MTSPIVRIGGTTIDDTETIGGFSGAEPIGAVASADDEGWPRG